MIRHASLAPSAAALAAVVLSIATPAAAQQTASVPPAAVERLDRFIDGAAPLCQSAPSGSCVDHAWAFGDADGDGKLDAAEAQALRSAVQGWMQWPDNRATDRERGMIYLGLSIVDAVGLERLMASFDTDGDGGVSRAELLADVRLDQRPLGEVLADPRAVDRAALGRRLGALSPMLGALFARTGQ